MCVAWWSADWLGWGCVGLARWPLWCGVVGAPSHCAAPLRPDMPLPAPACFSLLWLLSLLLLVAPLQDGSTPLYVAAQNGHTEVVAALVAAGASIDLANEVRGMVVRRLAGLWLGLVGLVWVGLKRWPLWCCGCSLTLRGPLAPRYSPPPASPCCGCYPCCCCCCCCRAAAGWTHPALDCGSKWAHRSGGRVGGCRGLHRSS